MSACEVVEDFESFRDTAPGPSAPMTLRQAQDVLRSGSRVVGWVGLRLRLRGFEQSFAVDLDFYVALVLGEGFWVYLDAEAGGVGGLD